MAGRSQLPDLCDPSDEGVVFAAHSRASAVSGGSERAGSATPRCWADFRLGGFARLLLRLGGADLGEALLDLLGEQVLRRPLMLERNFRRHRALGAGPAQRDLDRREGRGEHRLRGGRLVAAMGHAVRAFFVGAGAVGIPIGGFHQLREGLGVALAQQVAGLLPAENVARGHAPRRAVIGLVAGQEVQEQGGMDEVPSACPCRRRTPRGTIPWSCGD